MFESIAAFWAEYGNVLTDGVWDTLVMVVISTAFAYLIGLPLGVALILTQPHGIRPHRGVYRVLDWIVNIGRSIPFVILMLVISPLTRLIVGRAYGTTATIVPLVVAAGTCIYFYSQMKTAVEQRSAHAYVVNGSFDLTGSDDTFVTSYQTRTLVETDDDDKR